METLNNNSEYFEKCYYKYLNLHFKILEIKLNIKYNFIWNFSWFDFFNQ